MASARIIINTLRLVYTLRGRGNKHIPSIIRDNPLSRALNRIPNSCVKRFYCFSTARFVLVIVLTVFVNNPINRRKVITFNNVKFRSEKPYSHIIFNLSVPEKNEGLAESNKTKSFDRSDTTNLATICHRFVNGIRRSCNYPAIAPAETNLVAKG